MKLRIVISWAPYPVGSPRLHQQREAFKRLAGMAPDWCEVVLARHRGEPLPLVPVPRSGLLEVVLLRDASSITRGRRLPFLKDVLRIATEDLDGTSWGGLLNSDIVVTQAFFDMFARLSEYDLVICHRTDILHLDTDPRQGRKVNQKTCTDGVFLRGDAWRRHADEVPDYILGEPYWDTGLIFWSKMAKVPTFHMGNHEILHERHGRYWSYKSPGCQYNSSLGRKAWFGKKGG